MRITREEFKELVALHQEMQKKVNEAEKFINEDLACDLAFTLFNWIEKKLDVTDEYWDLLWDLENGLQFNCETDEDGCIVNCEHTSDLDKIYDIYIAEPSNWREQP